MLFKKKPSAAAQLDLADLTVKPLDQGATLNRFDCGATSLNRFLKNKALSCVKRHEYSVFVAHPSTSSLCIGYYALQLGSDTVPKLKRDKVQDYSKNYTAFPAVHLAYLAVDRPYQRQGLGRFLIMDVFSKVAGISKLSGFYALTLQSYDDESTKFYRDLGFDEYSEGGGQPKMLYPLKNVLELLKISELGIEE